MSYIYPSSGLSSVLYIDLRPMDLRHEKSWTYGMKVMDLRLKSHGLMTRKPGTYDLSYYVVKILILFAEIQEKQANISNFNVKI